MQTLLLQQTEESLVKAASLLKEGEIVAFPTETVYGLGAPLFSPTSIAKIFVAKGRPQDNPLIAHIAFLAEIERLARTIPPEFYVLAEAFFPGPLTLVLPKAPAVPSAATGGQDSIAVRMPSHAVARRLIELVGEPLVAPSANLSGRPSSTCAEHVFDDFVGKIAAVIEGDETAIGIESTVVSLLDPQKPVLLRPGSLSQEAIETVLKRPLQAATATHHALSPGMKYRHYAPDTKVLLFYNLEALEKHVAGEYYRRTVAIPTEQNLYGLLRDADREGIEEVCLYCDASVQAKAGLMNRLQRASGN